MMKILILKSLSNQCQSLHGAFVSSLHIFIVITALLQHFSIFTSAQAFVLPHEEVVKASDEIAKSVFLFDVPKTSSNGNIIAHVKFITPLRHKRDLIEKNLHVVQVTRPDTNSTLTIHLTKKEALVSPNLRVLLRDGDTSVKEIKPDEFDTNSSSIFAGVVMTTSNDSSVPTPSGTAALSACHQLTGLCGLIVTDKEHLVIQPDPTTTSLSSDTTDILRQHVILRVDKNVQTSPCYTSDERRVPPEILKAAADAELAEAETTHQSRFSTVERQTFSSAASLSHDGGRLRLSSSLLTPLQPNPNPMPIRDDVLASNHPYGTTSFSSSANSDKKLDKKVVEIAVFTDEDLFHHMRKKWSKDVTKKLKDYVITMINTMDLLYKHKSLGIDLEFNLVHLEIMKTRPSKLNKNGGRAMAYLSSFCDYAGEKNVNNDMWDHALLLTGMDLKEDDSSSTAGLAWAGTMCYRYYSCSISEGSSFGAAYIITHEIGHSLGMEHDGYGVSKTCDKEKFLMSPTTGPGKVEWSSCSKQNLKDFLSYGTSELRNTKSAHRPLCLGHSAVKNSGGKVIGHIEEQLPGQKYNASQQCSLAMGSSFKPVLRKTEPPFDNICWMLYCGNGTHAISTHPALDGSKCDDGKYCQAGKCVKRT